jgi:hypothetical protein
MRVYPKHVSVCTHLVVCITTTHDPHYLLSKSVLLGNKSQQFGFKTVLPVGYKVICTKFPHVRDILQYAHIGTHIWSNRTYAHTPSRARAVPFDAHHARVHSPLLINQRCTRPWSDRESGIPGAMKGVTAIVLSVSELLSCPLSKLSYKNATGSVSIELVPVLTCRFGLPVQAKHFCTTDPHTWADGHILVICLRGYSI